MQSLWIFKDFRLINTIYIESEIASHPRVKQILQRFANAEVIECSHYAELFNRKAQNFRLQKQDPALILAKKNNQFVLPAPEAYGIGGDKNYYFSHMLNCIYDCRYCFLQGMYQSANYVLFINYEDFAEQIKQTVEQLSDQPCYFFSGYDCDSLALEPVTEFVDFILPVFESLPNAVLELRTKSTQVRRLLDRKPLANCVVAFSLSPDNIVAALEAKTPSLTKRIQALQKLQQAGWPIGLRFDPLIYHANYQESYINLFEKVFAALDVGKIHSVSLGGFRLPTNFYKKIVKLYPDEKLFAGPLQEQDGMVAYAANLENEMLKFCEKALLATIDETQFFPCYESC